MKTILLRAMIAACLLGAPSAGYAQATRTWVSGVGDDVNPCSRTAPCKTFAGAISKTAAGGEISVLDPGGFGAITITKSISIVAEGAEGGVLAAFVNGVTVNAGPNDIVNLKGLIIEGAGTGLNGVRFLNGAALHIQDSVIRGFRSATANAGFGISFTPSGAAELDVTNTLIADNGSAAAGGGVLVRPGPSGGAKVTLSDVRVINNTAGVRAEGAGASGGINATLVRSVVSNSQNEGIVGVGTGAGGVVFVMIDATAAVNNGTGIRADGSNVGVRVGDSVITGNGTGLSAVNAATLASYGTNKLNGNSADGVPTAVIGRQ